MFCGFSKIAGEGPARSTTVSAVGRERTSERQPQKSRAGKPSARNTHRRSLGLVDLRGSPAPASHTLLLPIRESKAFRAMSAGSALDNCEGRVRKSHLFCSSRHGVLREVVKVCMTQCLGKGGRDDLGLETIRLEDLGTAWRCRSEDDPLACRDRATRVSRSAHII